ncbi:hypothetical protein A8709_13335 [Paenibacillus pectinilyticus]|uniref:DNA-binding response regulator n=1 Tax=Paenibacillus pectinilyticus TaxID=512399 RepID=A0A1C1A3N4_9BACL|nr:response regulator [Paenibacillus pectinilyticus]OCT15090.1 hypothetical protein A8709_13335 [Paenibacillus pectinilyticus]
MYKLLIVDDEEMIASMLTDTFREMMVGEIEVYKAYSVEEAQDWLDQVRMDVVLSDIKMPGASGLELMEQIKANWPSCRIIFLTGYKEFDYVYTAIQHEGIRFLLKTVDDEQIVETVREVLKEIKDSHHKLNLLEQAKTQVESARPLLQNEFLQGFIHGLQEVSEDTDLYLENLEIPLRIENPTLMVIGRIDPLPPGKVTAIRNEHIFAVRAIPESNFPQLLTYFGFILEQSTIVWLFQANARMDKSELKKQVTLITGSLEYSQAVVRNSIGITVSFALQGNFFRFEEIADVYRSLKQILNNRFGLGIEMILSDQPLYLTDNKQSTVNKTVLKQLAKFKILEEHLELHRQQEFVEIFQPLVDCLRGAESRDDLIALEIYYRSASLLADYMNRFDLTQQMELTIDLHRLFRSDEHSAWDAAVDYLLRFADTLFSIQTQQINSNTENTITRLKLYIETHLHEDLSLTRLANLLYLNSTYLSKLFKQVTDQNLSEYITEKKIDKAKELLQGSSKKINEISLQVGYDSQQSFTRFFKKTVGQSPNEFRGSLL